MKSFLCSAAAALASLSALAAGAGAAEGQRSSDVIRKHSTLARTATPTDANGFPTLLPAVKHAFETSVATTSFSLDCTYAAADAEGLAFPPYKGQPAKIFVKPLVCRSLSLLAKSGCPTSAQGQHEAGSALIVMIHESVHLSPFAGARDESLTQTQALTLVLPMAAALGLDRPCATILMTQAVVRHNLLVAKYTAYGQPVTLPAG